MSDGANETDTTFEGNHGHGWPASRHLAAVISQVRVKRVEGAGGPWKRTLAGHSTGAVGSASALSVQNLLSSAVSGRPSVPHSSGAAGWTPNVDGRIWIIGCPPRPRPGLKFAVQAGRAPT